MPQHLAYIAEPKFYYYFRPYNWFHIPVQQDDVRAFGGDPRDPYDNRMFQNVYQNLHFEEPAPEDVVPPEATPMGAKKPSLRARQVATDNTASRATAPTKPAATKEISSVRIRPVK